MWSVGALDKTNDKFVLLANFVRFDGCGHAGGVGGWCLETRVGWVVRLELRLAEPFFLGGSSPRAIAWWRGGG